MFPEERHVKVVRRIDEMEADIYSLYRKIMRLRLDLQREWHVLPSGARWSEAEQEKSEHVG
jgi:hypothetical protein